MNIVPGKMYWMEKVDRSKKCLGKRHFSIRKGVDVRELVIVNSLETGTDKTGDYILVDYTLCGRGTSNSVRYYPDTNPVVNFVFTDALS